jgi:hypothetical protein
VGVPAKWKFSGPYLALPLRLTQKLDARMIAVDNNGFRFDLHRRHPQDIAAGLVNISCYAHKEQQGARGMEAADTHVHAIAPL